MSEGWLQTTYSFENGTIWETGGSYRNDLSFPIQNRIDKLDKETIVFAVGYPALFNYPTYLNNADPYIMIGDADVRYFFNINQRKWEVY